MADTLGEIFNGDVTYSDLTNGEFTILTTNSTTSLVIKDVYIKEISPALPIGGNLDINGFNVVNLSSDSTGNEIVGPNSVVKVKSDFEVVYTDTGLQTQLTSGAFKKLTIPYVNNVVGFSDNILTAETNSFSSANSDNQFRQWWYKGVENGNSVFLIKDNNSTTAAYIYNTAGQTIWSNTSTYRPKWFDGNRYIYYRDTSYFYKIDATTGGQQKFVHPAGGNTSTYPNFFGIKDKWVFGWTEYTSRPTYMNLQTNEVGFMYTNDTGAQSLFSGGTSNITFGAAEASDGGALIVQYINGSTVNVYRWTPGESVPVVQDTYSLTKDMSPWESKAFAGNTMYYLDGAGTGLLCYINLETGDQGTMGTPFGTSQSYGWDIWGSSIATPQAAIDSRTYTADPRLSLRITGVTSTQG